LPKDVKLQADGVQSLPGGRKQNRLRIVPTEPSLSVNYLVVLRTGIGTPSRLTTRLVTEGGLVGAEVIYEGRTIMALFRTEGALGGQVRLKANGQEHTFPLPPRPHLPSSH